MSWGCEGSNFVGLGSLSQVATENLADHGSPKWLKSDTTSPGVLGSWLALHETVAHSLFVYHRGADVHRAVTGDGVSMSPWQIFS